MKKVRKLKKMRSPVSWTWCFMILFFAWVPAVYANQEITVITSVNEVLQGKKISGTVVDEKGDPIIGASVFIPGSTIGVTTDVDGNFLITVPDNTGQIKVSYIGYQTKELTIGNTTFFRIELAEDTQSLDEVVVIGYGTAIKRENIGAITSIKGDNLSKMKGMSIDALLQGGGTGLQVSQSGGSPGAPVRVMVRGTNSIFSETEPLWVIDGVPIANPTGGFNGSNPLATINPNDIESFEVLKDTAATAIYGSRGSSGVILVTTKTGKKGAGKINIDYNYGVSELTRTYEDIGFLNSQDWISQVNLSRRNAGMADMTDSDLMKLPIFSNALKDPDFVFNHSMVANTNWADQILRTGSFQEMNISTSQGYDKENIYVSANYRTEEGVLKNNDYDRFSFRTNANYEPVKNLSMGIKMNVGYSTLNNVPNGGAPGGNMNAANGGFSSIGADALPIVPVYDSNGDYFNRLSGYNLTASIDKKYYKDYRENYSFLGTVFAEYKMPFVEGLSLRGEVSADIRHGLNNFYIARELRPTGVNYVQTNPLTQRNFNGNLLLNFVRKFNDVHSVNVTLGTESQRMTSRAANLFGENNTGLNMDFGAPTVITRYPSAGFGGERYIQSFFARANYVYQGKYLIGGSYRRDGVSIFRPENRWSNFVAGSLGWILTEEDFMKNQNVLNLLKLRASMGQTGNQNIDANATYTTKLDWPGYGEIGKTVNISKLGSSDLTWETTTAYDIGVDFAFLDNRINGSFGYYIQDVKDLLFDVPVPISTGLFNSPSVWANVGDMRNQGFEFNVDVTPVNTRSFNWRVGFNITTNKNEVLKLTEAIDEKSGLMRGMTYNKKGGSLAAFYLAEYAGIDDETGIPQIYEIDRNHFQETGETVKTGKIIPATTNNIKNHKVLHKGETALPTFFGGINNTFEYKGIELSFMFTYQGGNSIYWGTEWSNVSAGNASKVLRSDILNNTWTGPGSDAAYPKLMWNNKGHIDDQGVAQFNADNTPKNNYEYSTNDTDAHLYKGDFIRLRNLQLAYNFDQSLLNKIKMKGLRIYISGNNLLTFTKYKGWDPEAAKVDGDGVARNLEQGVYGNVLPTTRIWNFGASITF
ncbi:MAG: TonB-dependent receptor [Tannerella sp.]|nr:TonB-dependent receptor [Tannerella sp.]